MFREIGPFELLILIFILAIPTGIIYAVYRTQNKPVKIPEGPLSESERMMHYDALKRNSGVVYALWFFLGFYGAHRIISGKMSSGIGMFALTFFSWMLTIVGIGFFGLIAVGIWWFIDVFLIGGWVQEYNEDLIKKIGVHATPQASPVLS